MIKNVIKRDGRVEEFSAEKINSWIQWSEKTVNPKDFNWSTIVLKTILLYQSKLQQRSYRKL